MALQWMILTYVVAAEAAIAFLLTVPAPKALKSTFVSLISLILQPSMFIVPFAGFQLLDIYWKNEHRLMCSGETCTASERDRYEKTRMDCKFFMWKEDVDNMFKEHGNSKFSGMLQSSYEDIKIQNLELQMMMLLEENKKFKQQLMSKWKNRYVLGLVIVVMLIWLVLVV